MKTIISSLGINRRTLLSALAVLPAMSGPLLTVFRAGADRSIG